MEEIVLRYETATKENRTEYFDADDVESLIDHYMEKEQFETALAVARFGISIHPYNTSLKIMQAKIALFIGDTGEAERIAHLVRSMEPDNLDLKVLMGQILLSNGRKEEAKALLDSIMKQDADYTYDVAYAYFDSFEYDMATVLFEKELKLHPVKDVQELLFDLAYCYQQRNDLEKAIGMYERCLDEDPYSKDAWFNLGQIHHFKGDLEKAAECLDYAYVVGNDYQALLQKGNVLFQNGKLQSAIEAYEEYIEVNGRPPFVIVFIGECYEKMGDYAKAQAYYSEALSAEPSNVSALCGMCVCLIAQDECGRGLQFIDRAVEVDPALAEAWLYKGEAHLRLDELDVALRCYEKAADLDPEMSEALFSIANVLVDKGDAGRALEFYQKAEKLDPTNEKMPLYYAIAYFKMGETERARDYFLYALFRTNKAKEDFFEVCPDAKSNELFAAFCKTDDKGVDAGSPSSPFTNT